MKQINKDDIEKDDIVLMYFRGKNTHMLKRRVLLIGQTSQVSNTGFNGKTIYYNILDTYSIPFDVLWCHDEATQRKYFCLNEDELNHHVIAEII